ncbi:MAG: TonB C-terminal domain-containing protein [Paracoccus sp. (in: a-proteobacteria)]|uniref:TonB C-terminal domain-containing protein n=1 Tax=Paracoccus sp. TaxID=267 RepID=UPI0026DFD2D3|nr:TonB C-terminal domain-containing protein [Paracoccus sp. (in: a-proteobacteria)]MDO5632758.1 TonB C-terminal domain-containing protein [Paracoccus sp. (in: a-proteobacteria)]
MSAGRFLQDTARWALAAGVVIGAHGGVAWWAMAQERQLASMSAPVYVELLDLEPPPGLPGEAAPPQAEVEEIETAEAEPEDEPEPEPEPEPEIAELPPIPLPPLPEMLTPPPDAAFLPPPPDNALEVSERPAPRPLRRTPPRETVQRERERPRQQQTQQRPTRETQQPRQAQRAGGGGGGSGAQPSASPQQMNQWKSRVGAQITRHMSRASGRGGSGQVQVAVTVAPNGAISGRLVSSTGNPRTDQALTRQAARLPRVSPPPSGRSESFIQPITIR